MGETVAKSLICPKYERAFQILGKRWSALIIEVLYHKDCRFSDLSREIEELSDRVLTERLKELEIEGIVEKNHQCEEAAKFTYRLTNKGRELAHATKSLKNWADEWLEC